jgi:hypothetical protein
MRPQHHALLALSMLWAAAATAQVGRLPSRPARSQAMLNTSGMQPAGAAPTSLTGTASGPISVDLSWQAAAGASGYQVFRSYGRGPAELASGPAPLSATSFTDRGARPSSTISYFVQALYPQNSPGQSRPVSVMTPRGLQPTDFMANPSGDNAVALSWTAAPQATGYMIHRSDGVFLNNSQPLAASSFLDRNVPSGRYTYTIVAYYNGVEGDLSAGAPSADVTAFPLIADAEQDFDGGKHGKAHAVLHASGALDVTTETWTNSPLQGFTMGVAVVTKDRYGSEVFDVLPGPYGVDGTASPLGPSHRTDPFNQEFDAASTGRVTELHVGVFPDPQWRVLQDLHRGHVFVRDKCRQYGSENTYLATFCQVIGF